MTAQIRQYKNRQDNKAAKYKAVVVGICNGYEWVIIGLPRP